MAIFETLIFTGPTPTVVASGTLPPIAGLACIAGFPSEVEYAVAPKSETVVVSTLNGQTTIEIIANATGEWVTRDGAAILCSVNGRMFQ